MYTLFYDSDCGFCQASVDWLLKDIQIKLSTIPYQNIEEVKEYPKVNISLSNDEIQLLHNDNIYSGAEAISYCLGYKYNIIYRFFGRLIRCFFILPFARFGYKIVGSNRAIISKILGLNSCRINDLR